MFKSLAALAIVFSASTALADGMRPITTKNLVCEGTSTSNSLAHVNIMSDKTGGAVRIGGFFVHKVDQLMVASEGPESIYIQTVVNGQFNLILFGADLDKVLNGEIGTTAVQLTGRITYVNDNTFDLTCKGDITSEVYGDPLEGLE